jgi:hypothetical protein
LTFTNNPLPPIIWVEGIGNLSFPFVTDAMYDTTYAHLLCLHENGNLVYEFQNYVPVTCSLYNAIYSAQEKKECIMYPNPSTGEITLQFEPGSVRDKEISIEDALGNIVYRQSAIMDDRLEINLQNLQKGIYIVRITGINYNLLNKLVLM